MGELTDESEYDADDPRIDFTPPATAAGPPAERAPTWLAASVAVTVALLLGVALAVQPAKAVSHGAIGGDAGDAATVADETPRHGDLFRLPEWHADAAADANADAAAVADAR